MNFVQNFIVAFVAFLHIYFMFLEMFLWDKPKGMKVFGLSQEEARATKTLAKNQGLYNGFLAAGLIWSILNKDFSFQIALFFLICVTVAGIYRAYTTKKIKLFYIQGIPAILGIIITILLK